MLYSLQKFHMKKKIYNIYHQTLTLSRYMLHYVLPCPKIKSHNQNNRTLCLTWVVPQRTKEIFIIVLPKKKAGGLEVLSSYCILTKSLIFFQASINFKVIY